MKQPRILILDGITLWPLGVQFFHALKELYNETYYLGHKDFDKKIFYNLRRMFSKMRGDKPKAYVHPKLIFSQVKEKIGAIRPTIIVVIGFSHNLIHTNDLYELKKKFGFQLVLWDTDSVNYGQTIQSFDEYVKHELMRYDKVFSFSLEVVRYMNLLNVIPFEYLHFGGIVHNNIQQPKKDIDLCFAGHASVRRIFLLSGIKNEELCIIGERWKRCGKILPEKIKSSCVYRDCLDEELYKILFRSKIILNITGPYFFSIYSGIALRVFEALGLGGFLLTDDFPEIHNLFVAGKEIETYSNHEEFIDKVAFYSQHDDARNKIAAAGHERFINNYTWGHQAKKMLDLLGVEY
jgi:hypothetical protein